MNSLIILLLIVFLIYMINKNRILMKRVRKVKAYGVCAQAIFARDENALMVINNYMETEDSVEFLNKARILKAVVELERELDPTSTLDLFDLKEIILKDGKNFDKNKVKLNSDTFVWMLVLMLRAHVKELDQVVEQVYEANTKYNEYLSNELAYVLMNVVYRLIKHEESEEDLEILQNIQEGAYENYDYDKNVIGVYKYLSVAVLAYMEHELDEQDILDLKTFTKLKIGHIVMDDLGLYETYHEEEIIEEPVAEISDNGETCACGCEDKCECETAETCDCEETCTCEEKCECEEACKCDDAEVIDAECEVVAEETVTEENKESE